MHRAYDKGLIMFGLNKKLKEPPRSYGLVTDLVPSNWLIKKSPFDLPKNLEILVRNIQIAEQQSKLIKFGLPKVIELNSISKIISPQVCITFSLEKLVLNNIANILRE
jgi:hypothetical protein